MNRLFRPACRLLALAFTAVILTAAPPARAGENDEAGQYIQSLGQQALEIISEKSFSKSRKQAGLEKLFTDNVDFPWVGRFVMGRFWRQANDEQKGRYLVAYQKFLILHYTSRFTDYSSGTFSVTGTRDDGNNEYTVSMQLRSGGGGEPVLIDYRVRRDGAGFKIFDVIVEGVSLITTQRSEFASVLDSRGIDYLIEQLSTRSASTEAQAQG